MDVIGNKICDELSGRSRWTAASDETQGERDGGGSHTEMTAAQEGFFFPVF